MNAIRMIAACALMLAAGCNHDEQLALKHARVPESPWPIQPFELVDQTGAPFSREHLMGRWTLLFSGFTHCPDICPATLGTLRAAQSGLERRDDLQTLFVSVDPGRDTPERLAEYLAWFDDEWIGITGERKQLDRLLGSLQMAYVRVPAGNGEYTMDHATAVALIDPEARMTAFWRAPLAVTELAEDLESLPRR